MYSADLTVPWPSLRGSEISRVLPTLEVFYRALDQQLSPGTGHIPKQVGASSAFTQWPTHTQKTHTVMYFFLDLQMSSDSGQAVPVMLEQLTKLLYSIEDKVKYSNQYWSPTVLVRWCWLKMTKAPVFFYFRQKVICVSPLDMTVVTGNLSYRSLCSRYFCKLATILKLRKMKWSKMPRGFSQHLLSLIGQARIFGYFHKDVPESGRWKWEAVLEEAERWAWGQILCTQQK